MPCPNKIQTEHICVSSLANNIFMNENDAFSSVRVTRKSINYILEHYPRCKSKLS